MTAAAQELPGLRVSLDRLVYQRIGCAGNRISHAFVYFLTISNGCDRTITLFGRKWVIKEEGGAVLVVEGDGIVGQQPCLAPGETFSYNSHHVTSRNAVARGCFFGTDAMQNLLLVRIPVITMKIPD